MPSLNLDLDYFEHPKVKRLVGLLKRGAEVLPLRLWCYCGKYHRADGKLIGYSAEEIESLAGWWGRPGEMIEAMTNVSLLDRVDGGFQIHDWMDHEAHLETFHVRAKNANAARLAKARGEDDSASSGASSGAKDEPKQRSCSAGQGSAGQGKAKAKSRVSPDQPSGFVRFWSEWPKHHRKEERGKCLKKWVDNGLEQATDAVMAGLARWKQSPDWQKNGGEFICAPLVWLNKRRWEVEFPDAAPTDLASLDAPPRKMDAELLALLPKQGSAA